MDLFNTRRLLYFYTMSPLAIEKAISSIWRSKVLPSHWDFFEAGRKDLGLPTESAHVVHNCRSNEGKDPSYLERYCQLGTSQTYDLRRTHLIHVHGRLGNQFGRVLAHETWDPHDGTTAPGKDG